MHLPYVYVYAYVHILLVAADRQGAPAASVGAMVRVASSAALAYLRVPDVLTYLLAYLRTYVLTYLRTYLLTY